MKTEDYFRLYGVLTLLLDWVLFVFAIEVLASVQSSPGQSVRTLLCFAVVTIVGVGLLGLRKWAALYFSVPLFVWGIWLFWTSVEQEPFPDNLLFMCEGISLTFPLIVTLLIWPRLVWRGKWFF